MNQRYRMTDTLFVGRDTRFFNRLDSTNNYAAMLLQGDEWTEGTVIVADEQTLGRGRHQRSWESEPGANLLCSILLKPHFIRPDESFLLNMVASVGVFDCLAEWAIPASIKWPNDVFHGTDKVSGILIETQIRGQQLGAAIIGIGININQTRFNRAGATSMQLITGRPFLRHRVLERLCANFEAAYLLCRANTNALVQRYNNGLYLLNEKAVYLHGESELELELQQVLANGQVRAKHGAEFRYFNLDDLRLRRM